MSGSGDDALKKIRDDVESLLREAFFPPESGGDIDPATIDLMAVLDSIRVLRLCAELERKFGVEIADEEISVENLRSLDQIARMIHRKRIAVD